MAGPNGNGNGEGTSSTGDNEVVWQYMDHSKPDKEGGTFRGSVGREGEIVDLGNGIDNDTNPLYNFRSGVLGLKPDQLMILGYTLLGYFVYTRFIK
ncbi:MAG: hypothetical protein [Circular genetic element sp.]|nr:MAG: hypothetical protein [Circular genetic element sp.]